MYLPIVKVFRRVFEDGLAILRERERELRRFAKEKRNKQIEKERQQLDAMEQVRETHTNTHTPYLVPQYI